MLHGGSVAGKGAAGSASVFQGEEGSGDIWSLRVVKELGAPPGGPDD